MGGATGGRSLEETPTWAVAAVCFVLVAISMVIEHLIYLVEQVTKATNVLTNYRTSNLCRSFI